MRVERVVRRDDELAGVLDVDRIVLRFGREMEGGRGSGGSDKITKQWCGMDCGIMESCPKRYPSSRVWDSHSC